MKLPVGVHERDKSYGRVEHVCGDSSEAIKRRRDVRVEESGCVQGVESVGVVDSRDRIEEQTGRTREQIPAG